MQSLSHSDQMFYFYLVAGLLLAIFLSYSAYQIYKTAFLTENSARLDFKSLTLKELRGFDGKGGRPAYVAVKGEVFDVSGVRYYASQSFSAYVGFDASVNLARQSQDSKLLNNYEQFSRLTPDELTKLDDWHRWYRLKYKIVGTVM